jgi:tRNA(Arg) A34 adenosine deaminase TadA
LSKKYTITAIIYDKRGTVLSLGKNSYHKTHPLQAHYAVVAGEPHKMFLHAEIDAIIKCQDLTRAHKLVVFRYREDGSPALARPCRVCQAAIQKTPIKIIEHT